MSVFTTQLAYRRRPTRVVEVGAVGVGGAEPVRIQSMLIANTWDVPAVMAEMRGLVEAGCEIVRLTVPTQKDLQALPAIRRRMRAEGLTVPLVADIHFNPRLALGAVPHVEKVRINPGNFVDQKRFQVREYSDAEYAAELARVEQALLPLIEALRRHGRALRVGANHGSLSDRIINRYGDTPEGMVESAMEYLRVLVRHDFHQTILSMKSSNPLVAIRAYRLLVLRMAEEGMDYPLHLGVTEAGDGVEGRIKSAVGIGALLADGLGDTVRVSLTEPAAAELPAARQLVASIDAFSQGPAWPEVAFSAPIAFARRATRPLVAAGVPLGGDHPVALLALAPEEHGAGGEAIHAADGETDFDGLLLAPLAGQPEGHPNPDRPARLVRPEQAGAQAAATGEPPLVAIPAAQVDGAAVEALLGTGADDLPAGALLAVEGSRLLHPVRRLAGLLARAGRDWPLAVLLPRLEGEQPPLGLAAEIGSLAGDGLLDAVICPDPRAEKPDAAFCRVLMQAARLRTFKAEYISCPSCGRTLFDLQETTKRIKARTSHLKGVKIGVMGCIVNGPGEMADADFGYVGGAPDKVNLYKGQLCVERGIPTAQAVERLVALIKQHGRWAEPGEG
ncbi:MAG: (E)-4-hydroxy-3-methylbut-2-enyl-diphosphate synthase [bacterium]